MSRISGTKRRTTFQYETLETRRLLSAAIQKTTAIAVDVSPPPPLSMSPSPVGEVPSTPFAGTALPVTGRIESEDFDDGGEGIAYHDTEAANLAGAFRSTGVDIENTGDVDGGYDVCWTHPGEYLQYTVQVSTAGNYDLAVRVANPAAGGAFHVEVDGVNVTGSISIPPTPGWQNYTTLNHAGISLSAGTRVVRLVMDGANSYGFTGNFNWMQFTPSVAATTTPPTTPVTTGGGSISGTFFTDVNTNGLRDPGESTIAGQQVYLDLQGFGGFVAGDPTATTDATGNYTFSGLAAGNYIVRWTAQTGVWKLTAPIPNYGAFFWVPLSSNQVIAGKDFGLQPLAVTPRMTEIINNGPNANRINIVILGDGYTSAELTTTYTNQINSFLNSVFTPAASGLADPFPRYHDFFNVYRIDVPSAQSGASDPSIGKSVNNALGASYLYDGLTQRLLYTDPSKTEAVLNAAIGGAFTPDITLVPVNDTQYGGGGGQYAVFSAGNSWASEIALHELGHSFGGVGDEYGGNGQTYTGPEPTEPNLTKDPTGQKWSAWLGYAQPGIGVIGAYAGGDEYDQGIYHPSPNSKMEQIGNPFNAIAREQIIENIYSHVKPIDSFTPNANTLLNPASLSISTVDPAVLSVQWAVDGSVVTGAGGTSLDLSSLHLTTGAHTVTTTAFDATDWVRTDRSKLQESVSWTVQMT